jgi:hypothetical protein
LVLPKKEENLLLSILTVETKPNSQPPKKGQKREKKLKKRKREREREREREIENFANTHLHGSMAGRKIRVVMKEQEA